jgi:hypothetical protein
VPAHLVDDRGRVVLLLGGRESLSLVEHHLRLLGLALLGFGDRGDELGAAAAFDEDPSRLARPVQLPVAARVVVRRVEYRPLEKRVRHEAALYVEPAVVPSVVASC